MWAVFSLLQAAEGALGPPALASLRALGGGGSEWLGIGCELSGRERKGDTSELAAVHCGGVAAGTIGAAARERRAAATFPLTWIAQGKAHRRHLGGIREASSGVLR